LLAVILYREAFPPAYQVGYGLIWLSLAVLVGDIVVQRSGRVSEDILLIAEPQEPN
jgi:EamA domain-containing membrane protein RarD